MAKESQTLNVWYKCVTPINEKEDYIEPCQPTNSMEISKLGSRSV
jgi:hypothetical protein